MMTWAQAIVRLQEIDLEFQKINERLGEIKTQLNDKAALLNAEKQVEAKSKATHEAEQAQRTAEFELDQVQSKLRLTETKLYGGTITNARELQDLQAEAKSLRRRIATLEEHVLEAMITQEAAEESAQAAKQQLDKLQAQRAQLEQDLQAEREALTSHGEALLEELQTVKAQIPANILDSYKYLKDRTAGMPVAQLKGKVCSICGVEVFKDTERKANQGEEAYCDGCRRLLVVV